MKNNRILLSHGSGGEKMHLLIQDVFIKYFSNPLLNKLDDSAIFLHKNFNFAFTTDSYVVHPLFFPGGDIGKLSVCGTINDLCMCGAKPLYLSASFIIEEGIEISILEKVVRSMSKTAQEAGIKIITGDTKVIEYQGRNNLFITTTGVGIVDSKLNISGSNAQISDRVILSGSVGDHEVAVLTVREDFGLNTKISSDTAPLNSLVEDILSATSFGESGNEIHTLRDPTRGGIATALNEITSKSEVGILIYEDRIPIKEGVRAVCELLGLNPLYAANEGKLICVASKDASESIVAKMKKNRYGRDAAIIGEVIASPNGVWISTLTGGKRPLLMLEGEQLPRIC